MTVEGATFDVRLKDICEEAVLVETESTCAVGAVARIAAELVGGSGPVELAGRVVRVASIEDGGPGAAVLFTSLNPAAATQIAFFIELQG
jgi:hypothetical protein